MIVFDRDGNFLRSWGEGVFTRAHGVHIGARRHALAAPTTATTPCASCTLDGKVLLTIGIPGKPAPYMSGEPFHRCTHTALSPQGRSLRLRRLRQRARAQVSRPTASCSCRGASPGTDPGQFNIPHNIGCDADGWVYVADRENHRVQVFDGNGKYETQWNNLHRPCGLYCCRGKTPTFVIGEIGPGMRVNRKAPNLGPARQHRRRQGQAARAARRQGRAGLEPGKFISPHGLAVDSSGDIYVGEVSYTNWPTSFPDQKMPRPLRSLQKLERI